MVLIRRCEEQLARSHQRGLIHGACHTYVGQEAIAAGVCAHLRKDDVVFSTHRGHGHALAKGLAPRRLFAELFGRATGCSQGRGGSMHLFAPEVGMMGTSGIVGPCILQAAGAGIQLHAARRAITWPSRSSATERSTTGPSTKGSTWPASGSCRSSSSAKTTSTRPRCLSLTRRPTPAWPAAARATECPAVDLDGNDVLAIYQAAGEAVRRARSGGGPTLLECRTYRTRPHAEGMGDYTYRTREEVEAWKTRCPIARLRASIVEAQAAPTAELEAIESRDRRRSSTTHTSSPSPAPGPSPIRPFVSSSMSRSRSAAKLDVPHRRAEKRPRHASPDTARQITYMQATFEALAEEMARDPAIFVMGEGVGKRGGNFKTTTGLYDLYGPVRLCDTPICERGFVGLGCGAAMTGTRPVVDFMFADFILDSVGEIINQIAKIGYMSNGRLTVPDSAARLHRHRPFGGHPSFRQLLSDVRSFPRASRRGPVDAL